MKRRSRLFERRIDRQPQSQPSLSLSLLALCPRSPSPPHSVPWKRCGSLQISSILRPLSSGTGFPCRTPALTRKQWQRHSFVTMSSTLRPLWCVSICYALVFVAVLLQDITAGTKPVVNLSPYATIDAGGATFSQAFFTSTEAFDGYGATKMILPSSSMSLTASWKGPAEFSSLLLAHDGIYSAARWIVSAKLGAAWVPVSLKCTGEDTFSASERTPNVLYSASMRPSLGLPSSASFVECSFETPITTHQLKLDAVKNPDSRATGIWICELQVSSLECTCKIFQGVMYVYRFTVSNPVRSSCLRRKYFGRPITGVAPMSSESNVRSGTPVTIVWSADDLVGATEAELSLWRAGTKLMVIEYVISPSTGSYSWTPSKSLESASDYVIGIQWPWYGEDLVATGPAFTILGSNIVLNQPVSFVGQPNSQWISMSKVPSLLAPPRTFHANSHFTSRRLATRSKGLGNAVDGTLASDATLLTNVAPPGPALGNITIPFPSPHQVEVIRITWFSSFYPLAAKTYTIRAGLWNGTGSIDFSTPCDPTTGGPPGCSFIFGDFDTTSTR